MRCRTGRMQNRSVALLVLQDRCRTGCIQDRFRCRTRRMQGRLNAGHDSLVDSVKERVGPDRYRTCKSRKKETDRIGGRQERR